MTSLPIDTPSPEAGSDEQFNPAVFAKLLLAKYTFKTTRDNETLYVYDTKDKIYKPNGEVFIKEEIVKALGDEARQKHYADIARAKWQRNGA